MSLGLVIFWKTIVLAIAGWLWDSWKAFKKKRQDQGLPLVMGKDGVFRPACPLEKIERIAIRIFAAFVIIVLSIGAYGSYLLIIQEGSSTAG